MLCRFSTQVPCSCAGFCSFYFGTRLQLVLSIDNYTFPRRQAGIYHRVVPFRQAHLQGPDDSNIVADNKGKCPVRSPLNH